MAAIAEHGPELLRGPAARVRAITNVTGAPDIMLSGAAAVRNGAKRLGLPNTPAALAEWSTRTAPWRSYLTAHLWHVPVPGQAHDASPQLKEHQ